MARIGELRTDLEQAKDLKDLHTIQGKIFEQRAVISQLMYVAKKDA